MRRGRLPAWLAIVVAVTFVTVSTHHAQARDYTQSSLAELHQELDRRPMGWPIGATIVGGVSLIAGGYLALYGLSFQAACQINGQSCDNGTQIAVGAVMGGVGAVVTTAGTIWLINWNQTREAVTSELGRRKLKTSLGASPLFVESGAGLRLHLRF